MPKRRRAVEAAYVRVGAIIDVQRPGTVLLIISWVCVKSEPVTLNVPLFIFSVPEEFATSPKWPRRC